MRFSLLASSTTLALLLLSSLGIAAQDKFASERAQKTLEDYRAELLEIEEDITLAREEWVKGMGDAQKKAMQALDLEEANAIQADLDSVKSGWPELASGEHAALVDGWTSESAFVVRAKKAYLKAVDGVNDDSMKARAALKEGLADVLKETLKGGSEEDLMEANRIQAWLDGKVAPEVELPKGWEIISSESEA